MSETTPQDKIPGAEYHTVPDDQVFQVKNEALEKGVVATMEFPDQGADGKPRPGFTTIVLLPHQQEKPVIKP